MILKNPNVQATPSNNSEFLVVGPGFTWKAPWVFCMQLKLGLTLALALHLGKCQDYGEPGDSRAPHSEFLYLVSLR